MRRSGSGGGGGRDALRGREEAAPGRDVAAGGRWLPAGPSAAAGRRWRLLTTATAVFVGASGLFTCRHLPALVVSRVAGGLGGPAGASRAGLTAQCGLGNAAAGPGHWKERVPSLGSHAAARCGLGSPDSARRDGCAQASSSLRIGLFLPGGCPDWTPCAPTTGAAARKDLASALPCTSASPSVTLFVAEGFLMSTWWSLVCFLIPKPEVTLGSEIYL